MSKNPPEGLEFAVVIFLLTLLSSVCLLLLICIIVDAFLIFMYFCAPDLYKRLCPNAEDAQEDHNEMAEQLVESGV